MKSILFIAVIFSNYGFAQGVVTKRFEDGQKAEVCVYSGSGLTEKLLTKYTFSKDCPNIIIEKTEYDSKGLRLKKENYYPCSININSINKWIDGKSSYEALFNENGNKKWEYFYNKNGEMSKFVAYKKDGTVEEEKIY
jgi:hypothetical protein